MFNLIFFFPKCLVPIYFNTEVLIYLWRDLSYNKIHYIEKANLENLKNLQKLYLNNNKLALIEDGSFRNTPLLQTL